MFLTLEEVIKWVGITLFEIWLHLFCILVFTVLIVLRIEQAMTTSWWNVFIPLFLADGLNAYFCLIVFIRTWKIGNHRVACLRLLSSALLLVCLFVSEFLFCQKLTSVTAISYSEAFAAIFIALQLLMRPFKLTTQGRSRLQLRHCIGVSRRSAEQLRVKDLPKVPTRRLKVDSKQQPLPRLQGNKHTHYTTVPHIN